MSNDISESGKAWIPAPQLVKHFKLGDVVFVATGSPEGVGTIEVIQLEPETFCDLSRYGNRTYLKLATVAWPEFPYSAEDIENMGREE